MAAKCAFLPEQRCFFFYVVTDTECCWLTPACLHLVVAILGPIVNKKPTVCQIYSSETLQLGGQPCVAGRDILRVPFGAASVPLS